jgi:hypothetical protein
MVAGTPPPGSKSQAAQPADDCVIGARYEKEQSCERTRDRRPLAR